jgi:hypothetical protein
VGLPSRLQRQLRLLHGVHGTTERLDGVRTIAAHVFALERFQPLERARHRRVLAEASHCLLHKFLDIPSTVEHAEDIGLAYPGDGQKGIPIQSQPLRPIDCPAAHQLAVVALAVDYVVRVADAFIEVVPKINHVPIGQFDACSNTPRFATPRPVAGPKCLQLLPRPAAPAHATEPCKQRRLPA